MEAKKVGRPLKFKDSKELLEKGEAFFRKCDEEQRPYTITGLADALDTFRDLLMDYESGKYDGETEEEHKQFSYTVKKLKNKCAQFAEERLFGSNATGPIFALKNYGWKDKVETGLDKDTIEALQTYIPRRALDKKDE